MSQLEIISGLSADFDYDKRRNKWVLTSDSKVEKGYLKLEICDFVGEEHSIDGYEMLNRVLVIGNCAGQRHAELILRHSDMIPEDWKKYILIFPDTLWCDHNGYHLVPHLSCNNFGWYLNFYWLDLNCHRGHRLVRLVS